MPEPIDYDVSDEDFAKLPEPDFSQEDNGAAGGEDGPPAEEPELDPEVDTDPKPLDDPSDEDPQDDEGEATDEPEPVEGVKPAAEELDYKALYEQAMAPFKANGREIKPKSLEDLRRLQEMGANYHQKMAGMKPARKALKTLENNGLLDETELSLAIDAYQGDPAAITALLQKHKIDPLDINVKTEDAYTPTNHSASDAELDLDTVLDSIKDSPKYLETLNTVTKEWDDVSQTEAAKHPQIISTINEHKEAGVYDKVMAVVQYDRSMGKLTGISDLDAYRATGTRMQEEGAFNAPANQNTDASRKPVKLQADPVQEAQRLARKKAASPTKTTSKKIGKLPTDFNPLDLSDEEFDNFDKSQIGL